jgi:hypothetical protein
MLNMFSEKNKDGYFVGYWLLIIAMMRVIGNLIYNDDKMRKMYAKVSITQYKKAGAGYHKPESKNG